VENELPLAAVIVPSTSSSTTIDRRLRVSQTNVNEIHPHDHSPNDISSVEVSPTTPEQHKPPQNGSYNNLLFREGASSDGTIDGDGKVPDVTQNVAVYSNIPTSPSVPNILKNAASDHVYSNIDEATSGGGNGYMSDNLDLDLDDPLLTSSFIKKKEKPNSNHQNIYNTTTTTSTTTPTTDTSHSNKLIIPSISSSSSTTGTQITSIELKNVLNVVLQNQAPSNEIKVQPVVGPALRRDTMIDTALDLDSLDGSSIGNSSQVGLMNSKTAIV